MKVKQLSQSLLLVCLLSCSGGAPETYPDVQVAGAMREVMWKGRLEGAIRLDTIRDKKGLYGLGPASYLTGEVLVNDGEAYVSRVLTDSTMAIEKADNVEAPFFVYGNVNEWRESVLPGEVTDIKDLESYLDAMTTDDKRPFVFKLAGEVSLAKIHVVNLPTGVKVSSPEEAHQRQTRYNLENEPVEIIGFFSTAHQGIFTHHDSFLHMHLITKDGKQMGHLDEAAFGEGEMRLYLPVR